MRLRKGIFCVLFVFCVPVALHKINNYYVFLGENYVHGIIDS